jgi:hypothetical protein
MKGLFIILLSIPVVLSGQTVSNTYGTGDIPTSFGSFDPACNGPGTLLSITLPAGGPLQVTGIDIAYSMTAQGGGFKSHQQSQVHCQTTHTTEATVFTGTGDVGGIQSYTRSNVSIANGSYAGGSNLVFEMRAWRTSQGSGCNTTFNKVDNFTWTVTVHFSTIPLDGSVGIGTTSPNASAVLDLTSVQKGLLVPRMSKELRDAIPSPAEGLLVYCTNCLPASLYQFKGTAWTRISGLILEDADGDTKIMVEKNPDEDKIRFDMGGTEYFVMNGPRLEIKNSGQSVFIGESAGANDDLSNNANTAIGFSALSSNTIGLNNTALGSEALLSNTNGAQNTAEGKGALRSNTIGIDNTANGQNALFSNINGNQNTATGKEALFSNTGSFNTATGCQALHNNTTGQSNTALGMEALFFNTTGNNNTANGASALFANSVGIDNTAIGSSSLLTNTAGNENTAIGVKSLFSNTTGSQNTATGFSALIGNTTGNRNVATGRKSLFSNTTGNDNAALGYAALFSNTTASNNTAVGMESLFSNTTGSFNTAMGRTALRNNTIGANNTAFGMEALFSNTTAGQNTALGKGALFTQPFSNGGTPWNSGNVAIGFEALFSNQPTTSSNGLNNTALGASALRSNTIGSSNTAIGHHALFANTDGFSNTATGKEALFSNTTGTDNTATGVTALAANTTGVLNTALGRGALSSNSTGNANTATGKFALLSNTTGSDNTALGTDALFLNTTGLRNTATGANTLFSITTGSDNTAIGSSANVSLGTLSNSTVVGASALVSASNKVRIGSSSVTVIEGQVDWSFPSDARFKYNVHDQNVPGLSFIEKLRPITYQFDTRKYDEHLMQNYPDSLRHERLLSNTSDASPQIYTGFLAQEVEQVCQDLNYSFNGLHVPENETDNYSISHGAFVPILVKSIQEQQEMITTLVNQNKQLEENYQELKAMVELQKEIIEKLNPLSPTSK